MENKFKPQLDHYIKEIRKGTIQYSSPSNIALVKYWGKHSVQLPCNPNISFTLSNCKTTTQLSFEQADTFSFQVLVDGKHNQDFEPKIELFFQRIREYLPFIDRYRFQINTSNTFPHSSGIASSASGMSALALCLCRMEQILDPTISDESQLRKASFIARIGSGSASRSVYGGIVAWGQADCLPESSDHFSTPIEEYHPVFNNFQDTILLVDKGKKEVSSTVGHKLMNGHPYAESRFSHAHENIQAIMNVLQTGDLKEFIKIVENEAFTLHAMMMTSNPGYMLFKPKTVEIIQRVQDLRKESNLNLCVTLDAGANVHLLYPHDEKTQVMEIIEKELVVFCENGQYICDEVGRGPKRLNEDYA